MEESNRRFSEHIVSDEKMFTKISDDLDKIKDNHLAHIQVAMEKMQLDVEKTKNDMSWVKWFVFSALGIVLTGVGTLIFNKLV